MEKLWKELISKQLEESIKENDIKVNKTEMEDLLIDLLSGNGYIKNHLVIELKNAVEEELFRFHEQKTMNEM